MSKILIYEFWDVLHFFLLVILAFPVLGHVPLYVLSLFILTLWRHGTRKKRDTETQRDARVMSHKRTVDHQLFLATDLANCQRKKGRN